MAKSKDKTADIRKIYRLFSLVNSTLLGVTLCLQVTLQERYLFLYNRGTRIVHHSFELNPKISKE